MKSFLAAILIFLLLSALAFAQIQAAPPPSAGNGGPSTGTPRLAPGSVIPVQLSKSIDAKKAKTGDPVEAKVTTDMKSTSGEIVISKDTKVTGRVTEVEARSKDKKESLVAIVFDHTVARSGDQTSLPMSIQAIIAPEYLRGTNPANNNGGSAAQASPAPNAGTPQGASNGRSSGMATQQSPSAAAAANAPDNSQPEGSAHPAITGDTKGVLGIDNLTLSAPSGASQGSVLSSDKNNVKLESGTLMLLRVN